MKPVMIRGEEYFPILSETCNAWAGSKKFECAFYRPETGIACTLLAHERSCSAGWPKDYTIFLNKEDQALAVMLGAEAPT